MSLSGQEDWKTINDFVFNNIQSELRSFNPVTARLLTYITENYQEILAKEPKYIHEEGAIVLYIGDAEHIAWTDACNNLIDILTLSTGKRVYVVFNEKLSDVNFETKDGESPKDPLFLKPGSDVIISA